MKRQIFEFDESAFTDSWYGKKIRAYLNAYGAGYDFCRLYEADSGGYILVYNSTMTADGNFDKDELQGFINMLAPVTIEVSKRTPLQLGGEYTAYNKTLFRGVHRENNIDSDHIVKNAMLDKVYAVLEEGFGITEFEAWYTDSSHRIRHGVSDIFLYGSTTVTKLFDVDDYVFLSHIATGASDRGKGTARNLLYWLCGEYEKQGKEVYLYAKDERVSFYEGIGFEAVDSDIFYERLN